MNAPKPKVVITGGSGFLGLYLARNLIASDYEVCVISRTAPKTNGGWRHVCWDAHSLGDLVSELDGAAAVVHLAGRSVDCIKSPDNCDTILRSRVETTRLVGRALRQIDSPPPVWVQMSTAHIHGDPPEAICTEDSPSGYGLAPFVAKEWERAYTEGVLGGMRQVILRTSFVLGRDGGALKRLALLAKLGLGGTVGHGRQGISWLHEEDMMRLFVRAITDRAMSGIYTATAPNPVSNALFMRELRKALRVPIGLPAMAWMVKLGAPLLMNTDPELALYGRYCRSSRLAEEKFEFKFPHIAAALQDIYS